MKIELRSNNCITNDPCVVCGARTDPCGLDPLTEDNALVCDECAEREVPGLLAGRPAASGPLWSGLAGWAGPVRIRARETAVRPAKLVAVATLGGEPLRRREPLFDAESRAEFPMLRAWHKRQRGPVQEVRST